MTEVKTTDGRVLFSFDKRKTTLAKEIGKYKEIRGANLLYADLKGVVIRDADIRCARLQDADLRGADLSGANLEGANFAFANLEGVNLKGANLENANFCGANLMGANLIGADLVCANFRWANLAHADLSGANLENADIVCANIENAKNVPDIPLACPAEGKFIAWKKVGYDYLVKLEIPEDAKRSSATTNKCRCDKAFVLDIEDIWNGKHPKRIVNHNYCECLYEVGKMVYPDWFDKDRWNECSHGIHFFMDRKEAVNY